ncbi:MAG: YihY/virulence factor BrkB family protein [Candidatus Dormibacteria bacterium]
MERRYNSAITTKHSGTATSGRRPGATSARRRARKAEATLYQRARGLAVAIVEGFNRGDLLTYSSAISFKIMTAIVPFFLFVFALAGLLHLDGLWHHEMAPALRSHVSPGFYRLVSDAVGKAFGGKQLLWASFGGLLALWQVSGAVRAVMGAFGRIYDSPDERSFVNRYLTSAGLAIAVMTCFVLGALCAMLAPFFTLSNTPPGWSLFVLAIRWSLAAAFLLLAVGLLVRVAPAARIPLPWVSLGAGLVILCWLLASLLFNLYLTKLASYESVFGGLASVIVTMAYLYISVTVFLFGAELDAIARRDVAGVRPGRRA